MSRKLWFPIAIAALLAGACSADDTIRGVRADGLVVECEPTGDDVYACDPQDEDPDPCEGWDEGGEAFVLWPPNHDLYRFTLDDCALAQDECDTAVDAAASGRITAVTSDEADDDVGDGNTTDDIQLVDELTVDVRSERQGGGDGRVYRIEYETEDGEAGACEVHVPHDRGPFGGAEDSGEAARVEAPAPA